MTDGHFLECHKTQKILANPEGVFKKKIDYNKIIIRLAALTSLLCFFLPRSLVLNFIPESLQTDGLFMGFLVKLGGAGLVVMQWTDGDPGDPFT